jgi:SAM-dependent methyltransferase
MPHTGEAPSAWVVRFADLVPAGSTVLDVACGGGRHARVFAARGCAVTAVDRDPAWRASVEQLPNTEFVVADLEGAPWPFAGRKFDAVIVTNYLHRPLMSDLNTALAPGGLLLYETFAAGNAAFGKPSNPDFLLRPGELLECFGSLRVIAFEDGYTSVPRPAMVQRLAARSVDARAVLDPPLVAL